MGRTAKVKAWASAEMVNEAVSPEAGPPFFMLRLRRGERS